MNIHEPSRFKRFINGRGFYVSLAVCLLAIGGVAVATFGKALFVENKAQAPTESETKPVEQLVSDLPDDRKTTTTTTAATTTATTTTQVADLYVLPFGNAVQKAYSNGQPTYSVTMEDWRTHDGADFAGELGQKVKTIADGTVIDIAQDSMWGSVIVVDHGMDVISRYYGVNPSVKKGDRVKVGSVIGVLATIPCESSEQAHLHFEMSIDGKTVDPIAAIGLEVRYIKADGTEENN